MNIPAILAWAPAHVPPGVLAVSALHEHVGKHIWILAVIGGAIILGLAIWIMRRRNGGGVAAAKTRT